MSAGINKIDSGKVSVYNGTGSTIAAGTRLTLTKATVSSHAEWDATVTGNAALADAVADEPIPDTECGMAKLRNSEGMLIMVAAAAFSAGIVTAAASGKVSTGGGTTEGVAFEAATADGDLVHVRPAL